MKVTKKYLANYLNSEIDRLNLPIKLIDIIFINKNRHPSARFVYKILYYFEVKGFNKKNL